MNMLLLSSVLFGVLVMAGRGPYLFAPAGTLQFYRQLSRSDKKCRILGVVMGALGLAMSVSASGAAGTLAVVVFVIGLALVFWMIVFMTAPRFPMQLVFFILEAFSTQALRVFGFLNLVFASVWIYYSFVFFF